jgi:thiosulfate/3-mercaptopyruvate sulfurtransferase
MMINFSEHPLIETDWLAGHMIDSNLRIVEMRNAGIEPEKRAITYCGICISASYGLFALYLAGHRDVALYDASWEEWGTNPKR